MEILSDVVNALVCFLGVIIALRIRIIPIWIGYILSIYSFLPFFLNDFLFPATYMSDQFLYTSTLEQVRSLNYFNHEIVNPKSLYTAWILSILPIPFVETVKSMGFYNRFLFLIIFLWLYNKNFLSGMTLSFILFYPSLVLYTSLSLREPTTLFLMILGIIFFIDKKYFCSFIVIIPLNYIKYQNFLLMIISYAVLFIYRKKTVAYKYRYLLIIFLIPTLFFVIVTLSIFSLKNYQLSLNLSENLLLLNKIRSSFYFQNFGNVDLYQSISSFQNLVSSSITAPIYFLIKPFPWEANNLFQIIQSLENIIVLIFLIVFTKKAFNQDSFITSRWLFLFTISMTLYGLVVFNYGTASRYKFTFIVIYVVGVSYELYKIYGYRFGKIFKIKF